jgi:hypothetical protein
MSKETNLCQAASLFLELKLNHITLKRGAATVLNEKKITIGISSTPSFHHPK